MSDERPEAFMMIGLHKLAAQNGDGLVPELYALLTRRAEILGSANVTAFPAQDARPPARQARFEDAPTLEARNDNVVAFPRPLRMRLDSH